MKSFRGLAHKLEVCKYLVLSFRDLANILGGLQVNWMHSNFGCWSACCALPLVEALETCKRLGGLQDLWLHVSWFVDTRIFFKIRKSMEFLRLGELVPC